MITAIVPLKEKSVRVENKNFRPFAGTTLADLKIQTLLELGVKVLINTDSERVADRFEHYPVDIHIRDPYYTICSGSEFFENIAQSAKTDIVMYAPCTAPFVRIETYKEAIEIFDEGHYKSVVSVANRKEHLWWGDAIKPLNYDPYNSPNSQDLPDIYSVTYGFGILSRENMINFRNIVTDNNYFYELDEVEAVDIDTPLEFEFAQWLKESM